MLINKYYLGIFTFAIQSVAFAAESSASGMPQLDYTTFGSQIFWLTISFALLYIAISRVYDKKFKYIKSFRNQHMAISLEKILKYRSEIDEMDRLISENVSKIKNFEASTQNDINESLQNHKNHKQDELQKLKGNLVKQSKLKHNEIMDSYKKDESIILLETVSSIFSYLSLNVDKSSIQKHLIR